MSTPVIDLRDADLLDAYTHGMDGGAWNLAGTGTAINQEIAHLKTQLPNTWLITLGAMQPNGGIIGGDRGSVDPKLVNQANIRALIQWGGRNAQEIAEVDWPIGGATIAVNGSTVRVFVLADPVSVPVAGSILPMAQGWVTPATHGRGRSIGPPTFTLPSQAINLDAVGDAVFVVPKRARAYRYYGFWRRQTDNADLPMQFIGDTGDNWGGVMLQRAAPNVDVSADVVWTGGLGHNSGEGINTSQVADDSGWIPLLANTTEIVIHTTDIRTVAPAIQINEMILGIQFALDFG